VLPGSLKTWVTTNGGELLDLCQDELRLGFIGYPKPVSDLPNELLVELGNIKLGKSDLLQNDAVAEFTDRVKIPMTTLTNGNQYVGQVNLDG
jgi:hypothetical protein